MDLHPLTLRRGALGLLLLTALLLVLIGAGPSSAAKTHVYYLDYNGGAQQHPKDVFFTANSGPRVLDISWDNWGKRKTVGSGTYHSNCNCPLEQEGPATLTLRKPVSCTPDFGTYEGKKIHVYRHGRMKVTIDGEEKTKTIETGYGVCR